jgi:hypothetical protein
MQGKSLMSGIAYLAGLIAADDHLEVHEPYITIPSKEQGLLKESIAPLIHDQLGRRPNPYWDKGAKVWKLRVHSQIRWTKLHRDFAIPKGKPASRILPPKQLGPFERPSYLRGWFEGESWPATMTVRRPSSLYQYPRIGFKVKNQPVRDWLLAELTLHDVRANPYTRRDGTHGLRINGPTACQAFLDNIGYFDPPRNSDLKSLIRTRTRRISLNQADVR